MKHDSTSAPGTSGYKFESGEFITGSPEETFELAKRIGLQLHGGERFLLNGDLGAGKTVFAKGIAAGLGIEPDDVTSPSFTLVNVHRGRLKLYHIDLYRLESGAQQGLGLEEIFEEHKAVVLVEWAERLQIVPPNATRVEMTYESETARRILITSTNG